MQLKYMGGPAAGERRSASLSLSLLRFRKAGVLPCRPAPGPGGARRQRLRARRKLAPLLLKARPSLPALLPAPGGAQGGQALLLWAPACRAERPCRAPGCLRVRPAAQQLLGKAGLLHTAAATGAEQRAASAAATVQCDRAGHCPFTPYIFPDRSMNCYERGPRPGLSRSWSSIAACLRESTSLARPSTPTTAGFPSRSTSSRTCEWEQAYWDEWDEAALRRIIQQQRKITEASKKLEMKKLYQVLIICDDLADVPQLHRPNGALDALFIRGRHLQIGGACGEG